MVEGLFLVSIVIVLNKIQIHKIMLRPEVLRGVVSVVHGAADVDRLGSVPGLGGEPWRVAKFRKLLQSIA